MSNKNTNHYFLKGGGEMGELIRAKDWSKTPLGDPADWPHSLKTMVSVMLDNPFGMYIAWGSEYTQLYNDGYRPILGATKHPQALGISTRETFSEIWDNIIGSMFDEVMKGNAVGYPDLMLPLNRNGYIEECYFDFSYSPIRKDDGDVGGVLVTVLETTGKKKAQSELIENTNQLKFAIDAAELGTWDYNPATNKFTANNRLKTWFGLAEAVEIELYHATDAIAEKDRNRIIMAIKEALDYSSGGNYEEEFSIINPISNKIIIVQVKGRAWFNEERIAYRFNGVLQEVTEKVLSRKRIEESEEQLRIAIEGGEFGTFDFFPHTDQLIWSDKTKELFGLPSNLEANYENYISAIHPEDREISKAIAQQQAHLKEGGLYEIEYRAIGIADGKLRWLKSKGKATYNNEGDAIRYTGVIQDITRQKEAAKALKANEEKLNIVIEASELGVWEIDLITNDFIYSNRYREIMGYAYKKVISVYDSEKLIHPDYVEAKDKAIKKAHETGVFYFAGKIIWEDHSVHWIESKARLFYDEQNHPVKIIGTTEDITKERNHQQELEESEERFRNVANSAPVLIWMADTDKYRYFFNKGWLNFTGRTTEQEHGNGWAEGVYPEDLQKCLDIYFSSFDKREPFYMEYRLKRHDGEYRWLSDNGVPRFTPDGVFEGYIGACMDVNNERMNQQALEESEQKFRLLADSVPQHIWTSDTEGNLNYYNRSVFDYTGLTMEQINQDGWIEIIHPDDRVDNIKKWTDSIRTGKDFLFEHRFRRYDGVYRWQLSRAIPQRDNNGKIQMWVGTSTDIQEQKTREEKKDEFISIASHEMKTPLTSAKGYLQILERLLEQDNEKASLFAKKAKLSVNRLNDLVSELLDVSKIRFGKLNYTITNFNFNDMIESTVESMQLTSVKHFIVKNGEVKDSVSGDQDRLQQVVINLLTNAIKYSPGAEKVFIKLEQNNDYIIVSVKDEGIGIAQKSLDKIFEKYHRVEEHSAHFQGLGIGLFISYEIIQRHHGRLWAESEPGKGSTFYFTIPVHNNLQ